MSILRSNDSARSGLVYGSSRCSKIIRIRYYIYIYIFVYVYIYTTSLNIKSDTNENCSCIFGTSEPEWSRNFIFIFLFIYFCSADSSLKKRRVLDGMLNYIWLRTGECAVPLHSYYSHIHSDIEW